MFAMSLAKELGKTLSELSRDMTQEEMVYWMAYARIENEEYRTPDSTQNPQVKRTNKPTQEENDAMFMAVLAAHAGASD